jgi:hypothetical protein
VIIALGLLAMRRIDADSSYVGAVLPALVVFSLGLALTVAPLTTTVLAALPDRQAGVASGVNNAVARVGGLLAVAVLPALAGLTGAAYRQPVRFSTGFHEAVTIGAGLCLAGGLVAGLGLRNPARPAAGAPEWGAEPRACPLDAPTLRGPTRPRPMRAR